MSGRARGFTLIELMIVIAIIAIIAAIAIPNLIEARKSSNEASAIQSMRTIHAAQTLFKDRDFDKDNIADYAGEIIALKGLVDDSLAGKAGQGPFAPGSGLKSGYWFGIVQNGTDEWGALGIPVSYGRSGDRAFYIDETGVIRFSTTQLGIGPAPTDSQMKAWPALGGGGAAAAVPVPAPN
jgi:type IV pilus assembly protein PilA